MLLLRDSRTSRKYTLVRTWVLRSLGHPRRELWYPNPFFSDFASYPWIVSLCFVVCSCSDCQQAQQNTVKPSQTISQNKPPFISLSQLFCYIESQLITCIYRKQNAIHDRELVDHEKLGIFSQNSSKKFLQQASSEMGVLVVILDLYYGLLICL